LKDNYEKLGQQECSKKLKRTLSSVGRKANRLNLKVDKNVTKCLKSKNVKKSWITRESDIVLENFNSIVKTDLSLFGSDFSYILGYLWGDGYLYVGGVGNKNFINLEIFKDDGENIKDIMLKCFKWNIYYRTRKNRKPSMKFEINNRYLVDFFKKYDYDKKSYISPTKILNEIPEKHKHRFLCGLSDADGCFYINKEKSVYQYQISSSYSYDWSEIEKIFTNLDLKYSIVRREQKRKDGNYDLSSVIRTTNRTDVTKFAEYIYSDNEICLKRKKDIYENFKNFIV